ncbi:UDP-N-acetylmuramoyl-tripeptide--D-alanyl-D-alanine ligase [Candidatus Parcubacteria bacterium]|nr:UDP-N-acetylmuramoyl-tripeptide--D-alanyl-D-alanine ligase [Candidatus Parcubacteria bacterium]
MKKVVVTILTFEAKILLRRTKPKIVAVIGSVGKTSVKDAIYAVLKNHEFARKSEKSYNSEIGVPLSVLGLQNAWSNPFQWLKNIIDGLIIALFPGKYPHVLVLEMGVDRPGDMAALAAWIQPDVVVLTRLPEIPVHVEYFDSPEAVIAEKLTMVDALKVDGVLIYNQDDQKVVEVAEGLRQNSIGYSRYSLSPFTGSADKIVYENGRAIGFEFILTHGNETALMRVAGSLGVQHVYNYSAAAAVGSVFGISIDEAAVALRDHMPPAGRMRLIAGIKDSIIIDDTYNSSPVAVERSLQTLKELKGIGRRIAVLGDMLELGQYSIAEHERIGALAAKSTDLLLTIGVRARGIAKGALENGMSEIGILQYDDAGQAGEELQNMIKAGDVILVKGSQSIRAERVVEEIMLEPEQAKELLVRQSPMWRSL